jgi:hypothetical protein
MSEGEMGESEEDTRESRPSLGKAAMSAWVKLAAATTAVSATTLHSKTRRGGDDALEDGEDVVADGDGWKEGLSTTCCNANEVLQQFLSFPRRRSLRSFANLTAPPTTSRTDHVHAFSESVSVHCIVYF